MANKILIDKFSNSINLYKINFIEFTKSYHSNLYFNRSINQLKVKLKIAEELSKDLE